MKKLSDSSILITGGTGSFGQKFTEQILTEFPDIKRFVIYSRDELKQYEMSLKFPKSKYPGIRFFLGDIRDRHRFGRACEGIDIIVHAAALKQVPAAEYNPDEFIKTNIIGAQNIIDAALEHNVKKVVALSTDKAAAPVNLYGATKLVSDKLFIAANNMKGQRDISFSAVRYGNVLGSRGSVVPFFLSKRHEGILPLTHPEMTRFNITLDAGVQLVRYALENALGAEIFVPKIPSYRITDLAQAVAPSCKTEITGIRPGEKIHEEMITESDSLNTIDSGKHFILLPQLSREKKQKYLNHYNARELDFGFKYNSGTNDEFMTVEQIRQDIIQHIDPEFQPL